MKITKYIGRQPFGLILVLVGLMSVAMFTLEPLALAQVNPSWVPTGSLNIPRRGHTATLLPMVRCWWWEAGMALPQQHRAIRSGHRNMEPYRQPEPVSLSSYIDIAAQRQGLSRWGPTTVGSSAELYDPVTGTWSVTGSLNIARYLHTATLLQNGKVLVAGGADGDNRAELYDPATRNVERDRRSRNGPLWANSDPAPKRPGSDSGRMNDNDVIPTFLTSAELYDPVTGTWSVTGNLNASRTDHTATLLPDGRVLIAAGVIDNWAPSHGGFAVSPTSLNSAELYDPATGTWSVTASLNTIRTSHTATLLPNGKVLVAGGYYWTIDGNTPNDGTYPCGDTLIISCSPKNLNAAELYDVATGTWSVTASLNTPRSSHTATLLRNGKVLVVGGSNGTGVLSSAELYNSHLPAPVDFDGDGKSDITIYRDGIWYVIRSSNGAPTATGYGGLPQDIPIPADYDGDGKTDTAIYRGGEWFILRSSDGGETRIDLAECRRTNQFRRTMTGMERQTWQCIEMAGGLFLRSSDGGGTATGFGGLPQDIPVPADYDGDGKQTWPCTEMACGLFYVPRME